jgi:hypothetical protein
MLFSGDYASAGPRFRLGVTLSGNRSALNRFSGHERASIALK